MAYVGKEPDAADRAAVGPTAGLCAVCRHLRVLRSKRSFFVRCGLAEREDSGFPRYPVLPVLQCAGWERMD